MSAKSTYSAKAKVLPSGFASHSHVTVNTSGAHNTRAEVGTGTYIEGAAGQIFTLEGVLIKISQTATAYSAAGGVVELTNDAVDWYPCHLITKTATALIASAANTQSTLFVPLNKPLPAGSNCHAYYTAQCAAADICEITYLWSTRPYSGKQTYAAYGAGGAFTTALNVAPNLSCAIPANKAGRGIAFQFQVFQSGSGPSGGRVTVHNYSADPTIDPTEFSLDGANLVAAVDATAEKDVQYVDWNFPCPGNSTFLFDVNAAAYAASTKVLAGVIWEG